MAGPNKSECEVPHQPPTPDQAPRPPSAPPQPAQPRGSSSPPSSPSAPPEPAADSPDASASPAENPNQRTAARAGDPLVCPMGGHTAGVITDAHGFDVYIEGKLAARVGDPFACKNGTDGLISSGLDSVQIVGAPAARRFDTSSHGGYITWGAHWVFVGPPLTDDERIDLAIALLKNSPLSDTLQGRSIIQGLEQDRADGKINLTDDMTTWDTDEDGNQVNPRDPDSDIDDNGGIWARRQTNQDPENLARSLQKQGTIKHGGSGI